MITTDDVYSMFGYGDFQRKQGTPRNANEIYNPCVPIGNRAAVDEHYFNVRFTNKRINSGEEFRCDYHTGDTADFMAMCSEMHINCDNQCALDARHNQTIMMHHLNNIDSISPASIDIFFNKLFGWKLYLPYGYRDLPHKTRYFMICNGEKKYHCEYLGLTAEQVKSVESFKRRWQIPERE